MPAPRNTFKANLNQGKTQIGCWAGMANAYTTEILGTTGFDWILIDGEHAPNDIPTILAQLQALGISDSSPVVRLPVANEALVKQVLDLGAQSLLIPMIESVEQAKEMISAIHYPPKGTRGIGSALARASHFSKITDYLKTADDEICLLLQIESFKGLKALDDILTLDGFDGIFIGPSDLAADMGYLGQPSHENVQNTVIDALKTIKASDKVAGILTLDQQFAHQCIEMGVEAVAVGIDVMTYSKALRELASSFKAR